MAASRQRRHPDGAMPGPSPTTRRTRSTRRSGWTGSAPGTCSTNAAPVRTRGRIEMIQIPCPHCGRRDEIEFTYRGDASVTRPNGDAPVEAFHDYVYTRGNPRGWHLEWW